MKLTKAQRKILEYIAIPPDVRLNLRINDGVTTETILGASHTISFVWICWAWLTEKDFIVRISPGGLEITEAGLAALHEDMRRSS